MTAALICFGLIVVGLLGLALVAWRTASQVPGRYAGETTRDLLDPAGICPGRLEAQRDPATGVGFQVACFALDDAYALYVERAGGTGRTVWLADTPEFIDIATAPGFCVPLDAPRIPWSALPRDLQQATRQLVGHRAAEVRS